MNGVKFLLDSCFLIRWYGKHNDAIELIKKHQLQFHQCAYSDISYAEVLGWNGSTEQDDINLRMLFNRFQAKLPITDDILECTISLRKAYKIKLPDALILATAKTHQLTLLTLDEKLERIFNELHS